MFSWVLLLLLLFVCLVFFFVFVFFLFTVLFTIISTISSTTLYLHMGLVLFLDKICSHEFIRGLCRYVEAEPLGTKTNVFSK